MFESDSGGSMVADAVTQLTAALERLLDLGPAALSRAALLDLLEMLETAVRRQTAVGCALLADLDHRAVAAELGYPSTAVLLADRLRIGRREAAGRVRLAADVGPRSAMSGQRLAPRFPQVAAAFVDGAISARHATVICRTIDRLPDAVLDTQPELTAQVEPTLVRHARTLDPYRLAVLARTVTACLDPDGQLATEADHQRHREVTLTAASDGSGRLQARLTAQATAVWQTVLDTLARPAPADNGETDRRSPAQRRHDALLDAGQRLLRSGTLPDTGGTPATVLLTLALDQLETRTGLATTAHGGVISIPTALRIAAEADIMPVLLGDGGGVLDYGRTRRVATPAQRHALAARDRGCSFPARKVAHLSL